MPASNGKEWQQIRSPIDQQKKTFYKTHPILQRSRSGFVQPISQNVSNQLENVECMWKLRAAEMYFPLQEHHMTLFCSNYWITSMVFSILICSRSESVNKQFSESNDIRFLLKDGILFMLESLSKIKIISISTNFAFKCIFHSSLSK